MAGRKSNTPSNPRPVASSSPPELHTIRRFADRHRHARRRPAHQPQVSLERLALKLPGPVRLPVNVHLPRVFPASVDTGEPRPAGPLGRRPLPVPPVTLWRGPSAFRQLSSLINLAANRGGQPTSHLGHLPPGIGPTVSPEPLEESRPADGLRLHPPRSCDLAVPAVGINRRLAPHRNRVRR